MQAADALASWCRCPGLSVSSLLTFVMMLLHPSQLFFNHVDMFSWFEPVLSSDHKVLCSKAQQHSASSEAQPRDLSLLCQAIYRRSLTLSLLKISYSGQKMKLTVKYLNTIKHCDTSFQPAATMDFFTEISYALV